MFFFTWKQNIYHKYIKVSLKNFPHILHQGLQSVKRIQTQTFKISIPPLIQIKKFTVFQVQNQQNGRYEVHILLHTHMQKRTMHVILDKKNFLLSRCHDPKYTSLTFQVRRNMSPKSVDNFACGYLLKKKTNTSICTHCCEHNIVGFFLSLRGPPDHNPM